MGILSSLASLAAGVVTAPTHAFTTGVSEAMQMTGAPLPFQAAAESAAGLTGLLHAGGQRASASLDGVSVGGLLGSIDNGLQWAVGATEGLSLGGGAREQCAAALHGVSLEGLNLGQGQVAQYSPAEDPIGHTIASAAEFMSQGQCAAR